MALHLEKIEKKRQDKISENYYEVLGVSQKVTIEEIKAAFRRLSKIYHPDKNRDNIEETTKIFQKIVEAYTVLSDPYKREKYDEYLKYGKHMMGWEAFFTDIINVREFAWVVVVMKYYNKVVARTSVAGGGVGLLAGAKVGFDAGGIVGALVGGVIGGAVGTIGGNFAGNLIKNKDTKSLLFEVNTKIIGHFSQNEGGYVLAQYILKKHYSASNISFPIVQRNIQEGMEKEPILELITNYLDQYKNFQPDIFQDKETPAMLLNFAKQYENRVFSENKIYAQDEILEKISALDLKIENIQDKIHSKTTLMGWNITIGIFMLLFLVLCKDCEEIIGVGLGIFGAILLILIVIYLTTEKRSVLKKTLLDYQHEKANLEQKLEKLVNSL